MPQVTIDVKLSDEDRDLMKAVVDAAKVITGKAAPGPGAKKKPAAKAEAEDDADTDTDTDADDTDTDDGADGADDDDFDDTGTDDGEDAPEQSDVQEALRAYSKVTDKASAVALLKKVGKVDGLSKLKAENYKAVIDAANAAAKKAKK